MAKFRTIKNSLLGGQVSPTADGRTDIPQYAHSCTLLQNMIPMLSGGVYRRPGTATNDVDFPTSEFISPRLIPFVAGKNEAYLLAFSGIYSGSTLTNIIDSYFCSNEPHLSVNSVMNMSGSSNVHPYNPKLESQESTTESTDQNNYDDELHQVQYAQSIDILWLTHPAHKPQVVVNEDAGFFQAGDFDYAASQAVTTNQLRDIYPYFDQNATNITLTPSGTILGSNITLTASASLWPTSKKNLVNGVVIGTVGSIYKLFDGATTYGAVLITGQTSDTVLTGIVISTLGTTTATALWWESAWSPSRGYPRSVGFYQQRLCMGGTYSNPDTLWFSQTDNFNILSVAGLITNNGNSNGDGVTTGPAGIQPFYITLSQNQLDQIQWISPDKELLVGTLTQEWLLAINSTANGFQAGNIVVQQQSKYGSDYVQAKRIGYELIMPMSTQDEVRAYQYNYIDQSFFNEPVQLFFDQYPQPDVGASLGRRKLRFMEWDVSRSTLWCLDSAGNFYGMTRDRKLSVTMWHTHQFAGFSPAPVNCQINLTVDSTYNYGLTIDPSYFNPEGSVSSFCCIPNISTGMNDIFVVIKRVSLGVAAFQLERITGKNLARNTAFNSTFPGDAFSEPFMVDQAFGQADNTDPTNLTYSCPFTLVGKSLVGNIYSPTYGIFKCTTGPVQQSDMTATITSNVPPDYGAGNCWVVLGLPFTPIIQCQRIDAGSVIGSAQNAIKKINRVFVRLFKTLALQVGMVNSDQYGLNSLGNLESVNFLTPNLPQASSPELFTGDKKVYTASTYDRNGYLYLTQQDPLPLTVISVTYEGEEFD